MGFKDFKLAEFVLVINKDLIDIIVDTGNAAIKPALGSKPSQLAIVHDAQFPGNAALTRQPPPPPAPHKTAIKKESKKRAFACFNCGSPDHGINECTEPKAEAAAVTQRPIDGNHIAKRRKIV